MISKTSNHSNQLTIKEFSDILEKHHNVFSIDGIIYDNILYCGNDNLYFSYCFNYVTGKATSEALFIVETITKLSDLSYCIKTSTSESFVFLKE